MVRQGNRTSRLPLVGVPLAITMILVMAAAGANALAGTWRLLPVAPIKKLPVVRASVWTGHQLIIHGDYPSVTLSYQPSTNKWKRLQPGPKASTIEATDVAVWTGSRMLVMGLTNGSYNPATNTWRPIAHLILPDEAAVVAWTGHQAIIWGGVCCDDISNQGEAYSPATNTWRLLPRAPLQARRSAAGGWTGKQLIVAGGTVRDQRTFRDGAAYNPASRTWRKIAPMPLGRTGATAVWDGKELIVIGGTTGSGATSRPAVRGLAYNPATNRWRWLPAMSHPRQGFGSVWTGHRLLVWGGLTAGGVPPPHGEAYNPAANTWSALPQAPLRGRSNPIAVWTGRRMIVWGGSTASHDFTDGAAFMPS